MFRILSIDPGSYFIGIAVYTLDETYNIVNISTHLMNYTTVRIPKGANSLQYRLQLIYSDICKKVAYWKPYQLAIEAVFHNHKHPSAAIPLAQASSVIIKAYIDTMNSYNIVPITPLSVKKEISDYGLTGKAGVEDAVLKIDGLKKFKLYSLSQHEYDALAIGYTLLSTIKKYPEIILLNK